MAEAEDPLAGGFVNPVVRVGNTVRRPRSSGYVHRLLRHLERHGWPGAPRLLGFDDRGREILTFLDGEVPWRPDRQRAVRTDAALAGVAGLLREFHDLTAGAELAAGGEVVCHNDLSPRNTVYRDAGAGPLPVAFLDWELAGPGERVHDVAHACWQYVGLGPDAPPDRAARRVRLVADAYGLADRSGLVPAILWWQDRCWRGIEAQADAGVPAMVRLRELGGARDVRGQHEWTAAHRAALEAALR
jgi:aminoglycoside phosphotransferase (APT) family kinase protein